MQNGGHCCGAYADNYRNRKAGVVGKPCPSRKRKSAKRKSTLARKSTPKAPKFVYTTKRKSAARKATPKAPKFVYTTKRKSASRKSSKRPQRTKKVPARYRN